MDGAAGLEFGVRFEMNRFEVRDETMFLASLVASLVALLAAGRSEVSGAAILISDA